MKLNVSTLCPLLLTPFSAYILPSLNLSSVKPGNRFISPFDFEQLQKALTNDIALAKGTSAILDCEGCVSTLYHPPFFAAATLQPIQQF